MNSYETVVVFDHTLGETAIKGEAKKIQSLISSNGGTQINVETWGRKEIPYITSRMADGYFVAYGYTSEQSDTVAQVESILRITDGIKRFQTHKINTKVRKFKGNPKSKINGEMGDDDFSELSESEF